MKKFLVAFLIAIFFIFTIIGTVCVCSGGCESNSASSNNYKICGVCKRKFKAGTEDWKSISKTRMCRQCYKNYKYAMGE